MSRESNFHEAQEEALGYLLRNGYTVRGDANSEIKVYLREYDDSLFDNDPGLESYYIRSIDALSDEDKFQAEVTLCCDWDEVAEGDE